MASLPTSFSVTSTRSSPIPNPDTTVRPPSAKDAEDGAVISTPLAKTSLDEAGIGAPSLVTSQSDTDIDTPDLLAGVAQPATPTPSARTSESEQVAPVPSLLTPSVTDDVTPPFPLNHARILYDNLLQTYSSVNSSEGTPLNALKPNTWERWQFDSTVTNSAILIEIPVAVSMDTICIGAHNLGDISGDVSVTYSSDGVAFSDWEPDFSPVDNKPIMLHKETPLTVKAIQIQIISGADDEGYIGYISAGSALQMQRPFFNVHTPITDADVTRYFHNETESGEIIGQAIRSQGYRTSYEWQNLNDNWYRTYFAPFKQAIKLNPFFIAWNLDEYPQDVGFGRVAQDISAPMQNGGGIRRSVSFELLGHG